ncbi:MAG: M23 family metallopeptidase, partial [Candidatus Hydrothermae bacterium]|nr:M23 family metallopeptidase [Candidatus Hydrothermae bacterium]
AHLNDIIVKSGQSVRKGDIIGHLGNTGKSTGPHLHYEIHSSGKPVDPMTYLFNYASQTSKKR